MATLEELTRAEHEAALNKKRETIEAYNRDAVGSYNRSYKSSYENSIPLFEDRSKINPKTGERRDIEFIKKIRDVAYNEIKEQQGNEVREFTAKYDLTKPVGPIGNYVDMPVRITDALGRDLGDKVGKARNVVVDAANTVFSPSGVLNKKIDSADKFITKGIDNVTKIITESPWIEKRIKALKDKSKDPLNLKDINSLFDGMNMIAKGRRRIFADLAQILDEWWHDPRTLCCLIKTLAAIAVTSAKMIQNEVQKSVGAAVGVKVRDIKFSTTYKESIKKYFSGGDNRFSAISNTTEFFDKMIAILKIIKSFLTNSANFNLGLNLDLGLSMSKASVGALMGLLTALQQMLENTIYTKLMDLVNNYVREEIRQCLPFERLMRLIADVMSGPDGIFKQIEQYIDSYMLSFQSNMQFGFDQSSKFKLMDIAALDKLINLLTKMRDAVLNLEMCVEADFNQSPDISDDVITENRTGIRSSNYPESADINATGKVSNNNSIIYPTDTEIRAFIVNRLGETDEFATQVLNSAKINSDLNIGRASGSPDNSGSNSINGLRMAIGDCARTLNSKRIEELANLISDWDII